MEIYNLTKQSFDAFALGGVKDWSNEFNTLYTKRNEAAEQEVKNFESKRIMNTRPSVDMAAYAGTYTDPLFGELIITQQENTLVCTLNNVVKATLEHWHYDTFRGSFLYPRTRKEGIECIIRSRSERKTLGTTGI